MHVHVVGCCVSWMYVVDVMMHGYVSAHFLWTWIRVNHLAVTMMWTKNMKNPCETCTDTLCLLHVALLNSPDKLIMGVEGVDME